MKDLFHGFLLIDKGLGASSAQVVGKVKWLTKTKCGHGGTLDPLATGLLPIALGEATKVVQFLTDSDKEYEFEITWGEERSTDDAEGKIIARMENREPRIEEIKEILNKFTGEIDQLPPQYSALKVQGKKAYELARAGKEVNLKPRKVTIYSLELLDSPFSNLHSRFRMSCSKGTYVRSIARDMGRLLGCYGYVSKLRRTCHGQFGLEHAITLENLAEICEKGEVSKVLLPLEKVLDGIPALSLDDSEEAKIRNGVAIFNRTNLSENIILLKKNEKLVALASPANEKLQPVRVFNH